MSIEGERGRKLFAWKCVRQRLRNDNFRIVTRFSPPVAIGASITLMIDSNISRPFISLYFRSPFPTKLILWWPPRHARNNCCGLIITARVSRYRSSQFPALRSPNNPSFVYRANAISSISARRGRNREEHVHFQRRMWQTLRKLFSTRVLFKFFTHHIAPPNYIQQAFCGNAKFIFSLLIRIGKTIINFKFTESILFGGICAGRIPR